MKLVPFKMERMQSEHEHGVKFNLSESGVEPLKIHELVDTPELQKQLLDIQLGYSQTNGSIPLRETIAQYYEGATADHILATNGGAEANFIAAWWTYLENPDRREFIFMVPNYMQLGGVWRNLGGTVKNFNMIMRDNEWIPDIEQLKSILSKKTSAIAICNPNNPTGAIIKESYLREIGNLAEDYDAWLISDEIYKGAEIYEEETPSAHGLYSKTIITSSLSKAHGLPGLRLGWAVCPSKEVAKEFWTYSDYTTICPSTVSDWLATLALQTKIQTIIGRRTKQVVRENWAIMKNWLDMHGDIFEYVPPSAAAICFIKQKTGLSSLEFVERLMKKKSVLISPGEHFEVPGYLRIGFGSEKEFLQKALDKISEFIAELH